MVPSRVPSSRKSSVLAGLMSLVSGPSGGSSLMATPPQSGLNAGSMRMVGVLACG